MASLLATAILQTRLPVPPQALTGVRRIVCVGDSITQSGERPGGYVWLIRHYLQAIYPQASFLVFNAGISGNKSTDMIARFQHDVLDKSPELILISVGVNDVWHSFLDGHPKGDGPLGIPLDAYRQNVDTMITEAESHHAKVRLLSATLIGEDVEGPENRKAVAYNQALQDLAAKHSIEIVDLQKPFRKLVSDYRETTGSTLNFLTVDGVHMNAQGNQVMAQTILTNLGVPDGDRIRVRDEVERQLQEALHPKPIESPGGTLLSLNKPAFASSQTPGCDPGLATLPVNAPAHQPWCSKDGDFEPNPWWMVDLGEAHTLTGLHILFHPEELDTWHYRVQGSLDGVTFTLLQDASQSDDFFNERVHLFKADTQARFVRIVFTAPTSAMNWAALRNVQVFGNP